MCSDRTAEGSLWQVDANLRPEGKDGPPLVRTIDSYHRYYVKWALSWEFQALLKARPAAGDRDLGRRFEEMVQPWVWQASTREGFVEDTRAMRRRVIAHIPRGEADRNIKLGPGGLRDVEFTVQLLQMVHGRVDDRLHARTTLEALARLGGRAATSPAGTSTRWMRPTASCAARASHAAAPSAADPGAADLRDGSAPARAHDAPGRGGVREDLPPDPTAGAPAARGDLLPPAPGDLVVPERRRDPSDPRAAAERLAAIGYRDGGARALGHIRALTEGGISRRAAIQRQLLPAMLQWFADGTDPIWGGC